MDKLITPESGLILWTLITFGLLLVLLRLFAWKPLLAVIEERERVVRDSLEASRRAREEAESALEENRKILAEARKAAAEVVQRGEKDAEQIREELLQKARKEGEEVLRQGREEMEREKRAAVREIRGVAADLALAAAEKLVEQRMDDPTQRQLVERYLEEMDGMDPR
jgi:F-type H+-transporting ATPase subunit b